MKQKTMKSPALNFFILVFSVFSFFRNPSLLEAKTDNFHICYFSLNNEKEFTEMQKFTKKLNEYSSHPISIRVFPGANVFSYLYQSGGEYPVSVQKVPYNMDTWPFTPLASCFRLAISSSNLCF